LKKIFYIIFLIIVVGLLQSSNLLASLSIGSVKPDIVLILIIYLSLNYNLLLSETVGFISGIIEDILSKSLLGINGLILTLISFSLNRFKTKIYTEKIFSAIVVVFITSIIKGILYFLLILLFVGDINTYNFFIKIMIPESLYNSVLVIIIFPIFRLILEGRKKWQKL